MSGLLFFIIGVMVGGLVMTMITSIIQINRINELETAYTNLVNQKVEK